MNLWDQFINFFVLKKKKRSYILFLKTVNKAQKFLKGCNICHNQYLAIDNITCSALQYAKIIAEQKKTVW